jgi:hypothetical protein
VDDTNRRLEDTQSHDTENADLTAERSICTPPVGLVGRHRGVVRCAVAACGTRMFCRGLLVLIVVARIDLERRWRHAFHVGGTPIDR